MTVQAIIVIDHRRKKNKQTYTQINEQLHSSDHFFFYIIIISLSNLSLMSGM